jgi:hypothetical protein
VATQRRTSFRSRKRNVLRDGRSSTLDRVRDGVREFILSNASIGDFYLALRSAVEAGSLSPNPLTAAALRKIVKQAIEEGTHLVEKSGARSYKRKERRHEKTKNRDH